MSSSSLRLQLRVPGSGWAVLKAVCCWSGVADVGDAFVLLAAELGGPEAAAGVLDLSVPDTSRRHLNWHALVVRLGKCAAISFQPNFCCSLRCRSMRSSCGSHELGVL